MIHNEMLAEGMGYLPILLMLAVVALVTMGMLIGSWLLGPGRKGEIKGIPYECGIDPVGNARRPFHARFYLLAIMFLVFDVELIFFYPWAVIYNGSGNLGWLIAMMVFTLFLVIALVYDMASGVFDWR